MSCFVLDAILLLFAAFPPPPKLNLSAPEEQRLVRRAQNSDEVAVAQLYQTYVCPT